MLTSSPGPLNRNCPCMIDNKCSKDYPKPFLQCTEQGQDSYPKYRRRNPEDGGNTGVIKMKQNGHYVEQQITNQWRVPYNPVLLKHFNAHINVELCSSINSIKYFLKYVNKGSDMAVFELQQTEAQVEIIGKAAQSSMRFSSFKMPDMLEVRRLLGEYWKTQSMSTIPLLCNWLSTLKMANG